jgi:hypothetical protein
MCCLRWAAQNADGKWIAYADVENGKPGDRMFLLNVDTLESHEFPHDPSCSHEFLEQRPAACPVVRP